MSVSIRIKLRLLSEELELNCVVRVAYPAFETEPVVVGCALCRAIVAEHDSLGILIFIGHGLIPDGYINVPELCLHVDNALAADGALVRPLEVFVVALLMYAMSTCHENNGLW